MSYVLVIPLLALTALGASSNPGASSGVPSSDLACWASHTSWSLATSSISAAPEESKTKITYPSLVTTWTGDYTRYTILPDTTLCDGYPRVTGRQTPTGTYPTSVVTISTVSTWFPPSPTCTVQNYGSVCRSLYSSFSSMITSRSGSPTSTIPTYLITPPCRTPDTYPSTPDRLTCSLETSTLTYQVLYWPTPTVQDLCSSGTATAIPTSTIRRDTPTATYKGLTMTFPTVYYILNNLEMKTFAGLVNSNRGSAWLPLLKPSPAPTSPITLSQDPSQTGISSAIISCNLGRVCRTTLQPFRFDHLATAPADKYYSLIGGSDMIYQAWYAPFYTLVPEISATRREWDVCASMVTGAIKPTYIAITTA
jgi:hypothetical protein